MIFLRSLNPNKLLKPKLIYFFAISGVIEILFSKSLFSLREFINIKDNLYFHFKYLGFFLLII